MPDTMTRAPGSRSPTEIDISVGERIRELRIEAKLTLSELGAELGISHQQLQKYETGTNRLSAGMLAKVAAKLRVPIQMLFDDPDAAPAPIPAKVRQRMEQARAALDEALREATHV